MEEQKLRGLVSFCATRPLPKTSHSEKPDPNLGVITYFKSFFPNVSVYVLCHFFTIFTHDISWLNTLGLYLDNLVAVLEWTCSSTRRRRLQRSLEARHLDLSLNHQHFQDNGCRPSYGCRLHQVSCLEAHRQWCRVCRSSFRSTQHHHHRRVCRQVVFMHPLDLQLKPRDAMMGLQGALLLRVFQQGNVKNLNHPRRPALLPKWFVLKL